jgi:hypothetical protein
MLTQDRLKELLHYDPETGVFTWLKSGKGIHARKNLAAGCTDSGKGRGYKRIRVDGVLYYAHRLAWLYVHGEWPSVHVDHHRSDDDRIGNLRPCTPAQNAANSRLRVDNTSGFKGVRKAHGCARWVAQTNRHKYIGIFKSPQEAAEAYDAVVMREYGEFALTNRALGLLP